jgi:hypothetical protein
MWSMQCNAEFGYQLSICSRTEENHGKPWSSWPIAEPSRCKLTSSQQSDIKYANPVLLLHFEKNFVYLFLQSCVFMCILWRSTKRLFITSAKRMHAYTHIHTFDLYLWLSDHWLIWVSVVVGKGGRMLCEVCCPSSNRWLYATVHTSHPLLLSAILFSVGDWSTWPPTDRALLEAFIILVTCKEIFCSFNVSLGEGPRMMYILRQVIVLQAGTRDAGVYHRLVRSVPVLESGCFCWLQTSDTLPSLTSWNVSLLTTFPSVHVRSQLVLPSVILLLFWGVYFEMSVYVDAGSIAPCRGGGHISIWNGEVIYELLTLN